MNIFSYTMAHDFGLAPNPFGKYCTLAVCKPKIRNNSNMGIGDWVIAVGSKNLHTSCHLIYAMKVAEIINMQDYWLDERFQYKKPLMNGSLVQMYGDNIYHHDESKENPSTEDWIQEDSAHSFENGKLNKNHRRVDVGHGQNVLIATEFYYWGENAIPIPKHLLDVCHQGRGMKYNIIPMELREKFIKWLQKKYKPGIYGKPTNWRLKYEISKNYTSLEEEE